MMPIKPVRLPEHIRPLRYQITLKPDLEAFVFEGEETISLAFYKSTKYITLHAKDLEIESAKLVHKNRQFWAAKITYDERAETVTFLFPQRLRQGRGQLRLVFRGVLNDKMRGFYRSRYEHQGKEKFIATTQFEATDARRAFPCFDEPAKKAVFEISLIIPEASTAVSNTLPIEIAEHGGGYKIVKFEPTPKMSTYLLAFIVGDFEFIESRTKQGTLVRVYTTRGKKHQAEFALSCAVKTLEFFNHYFDITYPLKTLDLVAIPDFAHGAMENWGAITYRENALLIDEEHSSVHNKQWVALVIAHEIAHQWFGNLVTMEWWTHLWLNEGFASYIEYLAVDHIFPKWDIWTQFAYNDLGVALRLDGLEHTHPIEIKVQHPTEISEIFDAISYSKGASVIRMLAAFLGEKNFRLGLRHYLKKHAYKNASTKDLWHSFETVSGKPVAKLMKNWTSKSGYPLIKIQNLGDRIKLTQSRFYSSLISKTRSRDRTLWQIPVRVKTKQKTSPFLLLGGRSLVLKLPKNSQWFKLNPNETAFARSAYEPQSLLAFSEPIKSKILKPIDRLGIVRDAFALAEAGQLTTVEALRLSLNYKDEDDYTVWVELSTSISNLAQVLSKQAYFKLYKKFALSLFQKVASQVGFQPKSGEVHTQKLLRSLLLEQAGSYGDQKIISKAHRLFSSHIPADIRGAVYRLVAENGFAKEFAKMKRFYQRSVLQEEKSRVGRAMAYFQQPALIKRYLEFTLSEDVRLQDTPNFLAAAIANPSARDLAWNFVQRHWKLLLDRYGQGGHLLNRIIQPLWHYAERQKVWEIKRFFKRQPAPGCERTIQQVLEKILSNVDWLQRDGGQIQEFLNVNFK